MQLNDESHAVNPALEKPPTPRNKKKNKKWPPIYALFLEENLMQPHQLWDDTRLLLQSAKKSVAILEEASRVGCDCLFSRRKQRWVLYRRSSWKLDPNLKQLGAEIQRIGNRDADYQLIAHSIQR